MRNNAKSLVSFMMLGMVQPPVQGRLLPLLDGTCGALGGMGGITLNLQLGDLAMGYVGDHAEPGVTVTGATAEITRALLNFASIGNKATVVSGDATGCTGYVSGKHGLRNLIVHFDRRSMDMMNIDDKVKIEAYGVGYALSDFPDIRLYSIDPRVFAALDVGQRSGRLHVPVAASIPSCVIGSGVFDPEVGRGDADIQTSDNALVRELGLDRLRLGDFVAITNADHLYGRQSLKGALSIGVIVHGDSHLAGHGPGVSTVMTCSTGELDWYLDDDANLARIMSRLDEV